MPRGPKSQVVLSAVVREHTHASSFYVQGQLSCTPVRNATQVMTLGKPVLSAACLVVSRHGADYKSGNQCTCPLVQPEVPGAGHKSFYICPT